jgi:methylmalonyl-CoA mutase cobalamin-binding subunit
VLVIIGGIISAKDCPRALGIKGVVLPGTPMRTIVDFIKEERPVGG